MDKLDQHHHKSHRIGLLLLPDFAMMSYAALVEPMRAANILADRELYQMINIGATRAAIASSGAAMVTPQTSISDVPKLDYLFVIAGGNPANYANKRVFTWLARMSRQGITLGGVSGGPFILAKAGLMEGRRITVHWEHAEAMSEISPQLLLEHSLFVIDRDRVTSAGGTAAMDLMHFLITQHHGRKFARLVSDWFMHTETRPSAGPQRAGLVQRIGTKSPAVLDAVQAMEANVGSPLSLVRLAEIAAISPRQLNRLFRDNLGRTVMQYYRVLRLEKASNLMRNSPLSLTEIALATGFAGSAHFSRAYSEHFGKPPSANR